MALQTLVVGFGSHHGDDRAGWQVIEHLRAGAAPHAELRAAAAPTDLLEWLGGVHSLHVCDACQGTGPPGQVRRWQWPDLQGLAATRRLSSHSLGLPQALALADKLGILPRARYDLGIEIAAARPDSALSAAVESAVALVAWQVAGEIEHA